MTYQPAVPEAGQSPYPLQPPPQPHEATNAAGIARADDDEDVAEAAPGSGPAWPWGKQATLGAGAAIGIGSAALVAALLYARRSTGSGRQGETRGSSSGKRKSAARGAK